MDQQTEIIPNKSPLYKGAAPFNDRMGVLKALNAEAGYQLMPETIVPEGTALIPYGEQRLRALKTEIGNLPLAREAFVTAGRVYHQLDPLDVEEKLGALRMDKETGKIFRLRPEGNGAAIGYTHTGLSQLVQMYADGLGIPKNFVGGLEWLRPEARAAAFNDLATRADSKLGKMETRRFRTILNGNGERYLRAVTSLIHVGGPGSTGPLMGALAQAIDPNAKARVTMTHDRTEVEVFYPMFEREVRVGDVVLGRQRIVISETKDVSASVSDGLLRILCLNFTTAWYGEEAQFSRRHVGNGREFLMSIAAALVGGSQRLAPFVRAFGDSYNNTIPGVSTRADVLTKLSKAREDLALPAEAVQLTGTFWDADGAKTAGDTLGGLVNAMTRASQRMALDDADDVERAAGRIAMEGWSALGM